MGKDESKKTMRFWIFTGVVAIAVSQIPMLLKKGKHQEEDQAQEDQAQEKQTKKPRWVIYLLGAVFLCLLLWLFERLI